MRYLPVLAVAAALARAQDSVTVGVSGDLTTTYALPAWPTEADAAPEDQASSVVSSIEEEASSAASEVGDDASSVISSIASEITEEASSAAFEVTDAASSVASEVTETASSITSEAGEAASSIVDATTLVPSVTVGDNTTSTDTPPLFTAAASTLEKSYASLLGFCLFGLFLV